MKDFDTCYQKCNDFMKIYESKIENMKELNFEIMTLEECKNLWRKVIPFYKNWLMIDLNMLYFHRF